MRAGSSSTRPERGGSSCWTVLVFSRSSGCVSSSATFLGTVFGGADSPPGRGTEIQHQGTAGVRPLQAPQSPSESLSYQQQKLRLKPASFLRKNFPKPQSWDPELIGSCFNFSIGGLWQLRWLTPSIPASPTPFLAPFIPSRNSSLFFDVRVRRTARSRPS